MVDRIFHQYITIPIIYIGIKEFCSWNSSLQRLKLLLVLEQRFVIERCKQNNYRRQSSTTSNVTFQSNSLKTIGIANTDCHFPFREMLQNSRKCFYWDILWSIPNLICQHMQRRTCWSINPLVNCKQYNMNEWDEGLAFI